VLQEPEPGLLVASGHYRNGVLLAPATAEWLVERLAVSD
jgi:glycine/D-amino acid oxidase-like deaminating enzyme